MLTQNVRSVRIWVDLYYGGGQMTFQESETIELKEIVVEDIKKEIIAFANSNGGTVYIGIANDGNIVGVENPDIVTQQIANMVRDSIKPDVTMFIHYETVDMQGKEVVVVEVQRGTERPYYLAKKGLRPEGVYVRQGTSAVPSTDTAIRRMIKETDGDSFENMRSLEQNLTFLAVEDEFTKRKLEFGISQLKTLGLLNTDGIYTNLGLLLSDQCSHTVKAAAFEDIDQNIFKDRREFSGSLLKQLNDVYSYIDLRNQTHSTFDGLLRIDSRDYPEVAVREALLNSFVHRDYSFSASTLISVYEDRIEFVSIGGLLTGISLDDIMMGLSICRNPKLANVFYRLQLIEAYGTGMRKIIEAYRDSAESPVIKVTDNAFKIILPNLNTGHKNHFNAEQISSPEDRVLELARKSGEITRKDVEKLINVKQTAAGRLLKNMVNNGLLYQSGQGMKTKYTLPNVKL